MSKLGWHFQALHLADWQSLVNSEYVKIIDPPTNGNPFPHSKILGRTMMDDNASNQLIKEGKQGAIKWFNHFLPRYAECQYVHAWLAPNEPPIWDGGIMGSMVQFSIQWSKMMHEKGWLTVGGNINTGHPNPMERAAEMVLAIKATDYWALHEYAAPSLYDGDGWLTLRYRHFNEQMRKAGVNWKGMILELGIDKATIPGNPHGGWKQYMNADEYMNQLSWYDSELCKDPYILCATPFTSTALSPWDYLGFGVEKEMSERMHRHINTFRCPESQPISVINLVGKLNVRTPKKAVVHHSAVDQPEDVVKHIQSIARYHVRTKHWSCIGYSWVIAKDGQIYKVNPDQYVPYHAGNWSWNLNSYGICLLGDFTKYNPSTAQLASLNWLTNDLKVTKIVGHKDVVGTQCPGRWWDDYS